MTQLLISINIVLTGIDTVCTGNSIHRQDRLPRSSLSARPAGNTGQRCGNTGRCRVTVFPWWDGGSWTGRRGTTPAVGGTAPSCCYVWRTTTQQQRADTLRGRCMLLWRQRRYDVVGRCGSRYFWRRAQSFQRTSISGGCHVGRSKQQVARLIARTSVAGRHRRRHNCGIIASRSWWQM